MMTSHVDLPREGHLQQLYQVFDYLESHQNARIVLDLYYSEIKELKFPNNHWEKFYNIEGELKPTKAPKHLGMGFVVRGYVDADHTGDTFTRRYIPGFIVFLNSAPLYRISKQQSAVESSTFGSEFLAMENCCEYIRGLI